MPCSYPVGLIFDVPADGISDTPGLRELLNDYNLPLELVQQLGPKIQACLPSFVRGVQAMAHASAQSTTEEQNSLGHLLQGPLGNAALLQKPLMVRQNLRPPNMQQIYRHSQTLQQQQQPNTMYQQPLPAPAQRNGAELQDDSGPESQPISTFSENGVDVHMVPNWQTQPSNAEVARFREKLQNNFPESARFREQLLQNLTGNSGAHQGSAPASITAQDTDRFRQQLQEGFPESRRFQDQLLQNVPDAPRPPLPPKPTLPTDQAPVAEMGQDEPARLQTPPVLEPNGPEGMADQTKPREPSPDTGLVKYVRKSKRKKLEALETKAHARIQERQRTPIQERQPTPLQEREPTPVQERDPTPPQEREQTPFPEPEQTPHREIENISHKENKRTSRRTSPTQVSI